VKGRAHTAGRPTRTVAMIHSLPKRDEPLQRFDWTTAESASQAVVAAVADESGADPCGIEPLYGAVDTDALDALFQTGDVHRRFAGGRVAFDYLDYRVELDGSGQGLLYERDDAPSLQPGVSQRSTPVSNG